MAKHVFLSLIFIIFLVQSQSMECNTTNSECNCPLSSSGETCTLSCTETDMCQAKTLNCRQDDPCNIECKSSATCSNGTTINAQTATDLTILCQGDHACTINIVCGTGACTLFCDGETSCVDWGFIDVSLSSSFQCVGDCPKAQLTTTTHITSAPLIQVNITNSHPPSYRPSHTPTFALFSSTILDDDDDNVLYVLHYTHYLKSPLFYAASTFFLITFCVCCIFCIWVYNNEQQQKRIELKAKSVEHNNINANEAMEHIQIYPLHDIKQVFKDSIASSDLYEYDDDDDDREGPIPTYLKIQTADMISHRAVMKPNTNIKCQIPKIEVANHALPNLPPPRSLVSLPQTHPHSPWSSPPQTPIPNDVYRMPKHEDMQQLTEFDPGVHDYYHVRYASLPTVPSLPSITNDPIEPSVSSATMRVSMVSCMVLDEDSAAEELEVDELESESAEYQSHRRRTYESYDYMNPSPFSKPFSVGGNVTKQISSTIKLHDICEAKREDVHISASKSFDSETSVSKLSQDEDQDIKTEIERENSNITDLERNKSTAL